MVEIVIRLTGEDIQGKPLKVEFFGVNKDATVKETYWGNKIVNAVRWILKDKTPSDANKTNPS